MDEKIRIVVDAMGGDNAPEAPIHGAVDALAENNKIEITLVGRTPDIEAELAKYSYDKDRVHIVNAEDVIGFDEPPVEAIRKKKDSSIVVGMKLVKKGEADAFVSAGSTGAILVGGQLVVGRIRGIERAPLAKMGSIYMENIVGIKNPRVAIVNIGAEEEKGNALVKETYPLLKECEDINFIGSIEARDIPKGGADVIVCEAFVGNVILKLYEGLGSALLHKVKEGLMSSLRSKIGALLIKPALKKTLKAFDASEHGGAPLLGLKGLVVKAHGSSSEVEIKTAILQCISFSEEGINDRIRENLKLD